jgi:fumarate hydratase subunit alpha
MTITYKDIQQAARRCLIEAGTSSSPDRLNACRRALESERSQNARWVLEQIIENAQIAQQEQLPLCDDTGIPHVIVHIGDNCRLPDGWLTAIETGIAQGLREMPGRPMAVRGDDVERVEQSDGLHPDPGALETAPVIVRAQKGERLTLTVLLLGGGPEIRARTRRIFHKRSMALVLEEVGGWLAEEVGSLGCTPTVPAIGIGRSQVEASTLMLEAMAQGNLDRQNEMEQKITRMVNQSGVGPLGLGGGTTALGCFMKIGPIRASGVRIVCARPCCLVEPRRAMETLE